MKNMRSIKSPLVISLITLLLFQTGCSSSELADFKTIFDTVNGVLTDTKPAVDALAANGSLGKTEGKVFDDIQAIIAKDNPSIQAITVWPPANAQQYYNDLFPLVAELQSAIVDPTTHPALSLALTTIEVLIQQLLTRLASVPTVTAPSGTASGRVSRAEPVSGQTFVVQLSTGQIKQKLSELKSQCAAIKAQAGK